MKNIICSCFLIIVCMNYSFAQHNTFGILTYTVPAGYEVIDHPNVLTYLKENKTTGTYCNIFIYKQMQGQGDVQKDFNYCWENLVQKPFKVTGTAQTLPAANAKGWQFILGQSNYSDNGVATVAMQICFSGDNSMQSICILSNNDQYKKDIESFVASVEVTKDISSVKNNNPTSTPTKVETNNPGIIADGSVVGTWTYYKREGGSSDALSPLWVITMSRYKYGYTFNKDGTYEYFKKIYFKHDPKLYFQYEAGTYTISGNQITVKPTKGQNEEWSKKGTEGDLREEFGSRQKTTPRKLETITYTFEKKILPVDHITHLFLHYNKTTERDANYTYDEAQQLWKYSPDNASAKDLPPGFKLADATVTKNAAVTKTTDDITTHPKYELWMASQTNISTLNLEYRYVVLSADASCLFYLPEGGLYNFTKANSNQTNSWGTVTDKGNTLLLNNDLRGKMELYKKSPTAMAPYENSKPFNYYKKCLPVNGLRLEGAYSTLVGYYKKKPDFVTQNIDPNKRPIIFFKKDGTYINEGLEFSNITKGDDFAIGKGTYEIKDFSIILTTQSGRKLQLAFTGILDSDPAKNPGGYMINNVLFYQLDQSFQPH